MGEFSESLFQEVTHAIGLKSSPPRCLDILPRSCPCKRRRYEKQIYSPRWFGLLWVEMLYAGGILKNHEEEVIA